MRYRSELDFNNRFFVRLVTGSIQDIPGIVVYQFLYYLQHFDLIDFLLKPISYAKTDF